MENDCVRETETLVANLDQITVKQEILDEGYHSVVSDSKICCDKGQNHSKTICKAYDLCHFNGDEANTKCFGNIFISIVRPKTETEILVKEADYVQERREHENKVFISDKESEIKKENVIENHLEFNDSNTIIEENESVKLECQEEKVKKEAEEEILNDLEITNQQYEEESVKVEEVVISQIMDTIKDDIVGSSETNIKTKDENVTEDDSDTNAPGMILMEECPEKDVHVALEKKGYVCQICKKTFIKKSSLSSHEMTHTGETPYKCQICQKGFNVRSNLNVHMRIHTGQRPHECEICQKTFRQAGQLKTHERIHKGEKPYICSMCARSFRSSSALITHQRTHTGERPFPCDLCSRSFSTSTSLKTHRITHSGTMLYDCPVCGRQFNRKNNLNVHIKRHNKNRKFSCPKCSNGFVMRAHLLGHLKRAHKVELQTDQLKYPDFLDCSEEFCLKGEAVEQCGVKVHLKCEQEIDMKTEYMYVREDTSLHYNINGNSDASIKDELEDVG